MDSFHYTFYAEQVIFGAGALAQLGEAVDRFGFQRIMLCTTPHSRSRGQVTLIEAALGDRLALAYSDVAAHVPETAVAEALLLAGNYPVDAVLGFGGGSSIGTAKALSLALEEQRTGQPAHAATPTDQPLIPVIAIPTTYSGSEMTPVYGVTRRGDGAAQKVTVSDAKVTPKLAIYDPLLTLELPPRVTAGTGINAVAHCIEALYSITANPVSSALAKGGLQALAHALLRCYSRGDDIPARTELLMGSFMAGSALSNVSMGLHHGICHVLGGSTGVAHGDANSVMLPHVIRFNLDVAAVPLAQAALAMGIVSNRAAEESPEAAAEATERQVADWVRDMHLPSKLREIGVLESDLPAIAQMAMANRTVQNNPKPIRSVGQIEMLLREAW